MHFLSLLACFLPFADMNPSAYTDQMASDLMVVPLHHGSLASVLFGTLLVWTPLQPHT